MCSTCKLTATFTLFPVLSLWVCPHTIKVSLPTLSPLTLLTWAKIPGSLRTSTTSMFALWSGEAWEQGYAAAQLTLLAPSPGFTSNFCSPILFLNFWIVYVWGADYGLNPGNIAIGVLSILSSLRLLSDQFYWLSPLLLASESSMELLNSKLEQPLPLERFRPNIILSGCLPHSEVGLETVFWIWTGACFSYLYRFPHSLILNLLLTPLIFHSLIHSLTLSYSSLISRFL